MQLWIKPEGSRSRESSPRRAAREGSTVDSGKIDRRKSLFSWRLKRGRIEANVGIGEKTKCGVKAPVSTWLGILTKAGMQKFEITLP